MVEKITIDLPACGNKSMMNLTVTSDNDFGIGNSEAIIIYVNEKECKKDKN